MKTDHSSPKRHSLLERGLAVCLTLALALGPIPSWAQATATSPEAGTVILVRGDVQAVDANGTARSLRRRDAVQVGDTLITGDDAYAQVRMVDDAQIALQENTRFAVVDYRYTGTPGSDVSRLSLLEGGFRTITGAIGQQNRDAYETEVAGFATIGIRGTDYQVVILPGNRIVTGVFDGGTTVSNGVGALNLGIGADFDFAEIENPNSPPTGVTEQPPELGDIALTVTADDDAAPGPTDDAATGGSDPDDNGDAATGTPAATNGAPAGNGGGNGTTDTTSNPVAGTPSDTGNDASSSGTPANATQNTPAASTLNAFVATDSTAIEPSAAANLAAPQETVTVNPNETRGDGSVSGTINRGSASDGIGNANNGNAGGNSSNAGNSGSSAGGSSNSGGNSTSGGGTTTGNTTNSTSGNSGNGGGNSGNSSSNSGGSSSGGGNSTSGGGTTTGTTTGGTTTSGNSGSGNSGNSGNGNGNGGGNSGNNNAGNGNGNSGNGGGGNTTTATASLMIAPASRDQFAIGWGAWERPLPTQGFEVAQNSRQLQVSAGGYQAAFQAPAIANLTGSHRYASSLSSDFIGHGHGGAVDAVVASFDVDFATGTLSNGALAVQSSASLWNVTFAGNVQNGIADLSATSAQLFEAGQLTSTTLEAQLGGAFAGPSGEAFVGGFDLYDAGNPARFVEGLYVIER